MEHGNRILQVLREKYERELVGEFAENPEPGDIMLATGNGVNVQSEIVRYLGPFQCADHDEWRVASIYPLCPACGEHRECAHESIIPAGSLLKTRAAKD